MKNILICFGIAILVFAAFAFGTTIDNGRYKIIMHPRAVYYHLLDTRTGRTWQMTQESRGKYVFWQEIPRYELPLSTEQE